MTALFRRPRRSLVVLGIMIGLSCTCEFAQADDWPQWRGQRRDAVSLEKGLLQSWPEAGPKLAWKAAAIGTGYSSVVVGQGRAYTMGRVEADVIVSALEAATGKTVWTKKIGETTRNPCSTPTLDGELLYVLDPDGDLVCLQSATGAVVWQRSFVDDFGGRMMSGRGYGESPLVDGDRLIVTPGGIDAAMVALEKRTGKVIWKSALPDVGAVGRDGAGFSSIVVTEAAGVRQYVQLMGRGLVGTDVRDGRFLWCFNDLANATANIPTPIVDQDYVFAANGYSAGSVLLKIVSDSVAGSEPMKVKAEVVYTLSASQFQNHHGGFLKLGDFIFAGHGNNNGLPTCLDFKTGKIHWKRRGPGVGSAAVIYADRQLYFRYQNGLVALIEPTDRGLQVNGSFEVPGAGGDSWAHPAIANGLLYLREQDNLWVYDLRHGSAETIATTEPTPDPADNQTINALEKLGVTVVRLPRPVTGGPGLSTEIRGRSYQYALTPVEGTAQGPVLLVSLGNQQLTPEGQISTAVLDLLKNLNVPMIVSLAGSQASDDAVKQLQMLPLAGLNLELCPRLTDAGLIHLTGVKTLRELILTGTHITPVGLRPLNGQLELLAVDLELCDGIDDAACEVLGQWKSLRSLVFKKSGFEKRSITDAGLKQLQSLSDLEVLNLYGNHVTDAGLISLQSHLKLRDVNLSLMAITDAGLQHLKPLAQLERLEVLYSEGFAGPKLTDGLSDPLAGLPGLKSLNLTGARLTDAGLERLHGLKNLTHLQLVRTRVTDAGVTKIQVAIPDCKIVK